MRTVILNMCSNKISLKRTFEPIPEGSESEPSGGLAEAHFRTCAKVLGQDHVWCGGRVVRKPVLLRQSMRGGEREEMRAGR